ncbi:hypothetical protein GCM10029978_023610 [Actinoallomurus acanthiterrae]
MNGPLSGRTAQEDQDRARPRVPRDRRRRHTTFQEVMTGGVRLDGEDRPMRLELHADLPEPLRPWGDTEGMLTGRVLVPGWADDPYATGVLRVAPIAARRIRYRMEFRTVDGRAMFLDGWKSVSYRRPVHSMTYLPVTITDADGGVVAEARLRFDLRDLASFVAGFRLPRTDQAGADRRSDVRAGADRRSDPRASADRRSDARAGAGRRSDARASAGRAVAYDAAELFRSRWRGQPGRLEVWYTTLTDPATGTGVWLHHELVAPSDGAPARGHGWVALFPPGERPVLERFGPETWAAPGGTPTAEPTSLVAAASGGWEAGDAKVSAGREAEGAAVPAGFSCAGVEATADRLSGRAGTLSWDLTTSGGGAPLYTFPRWAWRREALPAAQIVPAPTARYDGTVRCGDRVLELRGAPGGSARIYGHGNAERWAWLHADLGDGDVCEVVAAVSTRKLLDRLRPLPFVRLRVDGMDWSDGDPLLTALRARADVGLPSWRVRARSRDRAVTVEVTLPQAETVAVDYTDPDGRAATCHNSERADAVITLLRRSGSRWLTERRWRLDGTAHAEVGLR